ncbi:uncharacterized protein LOC135112070 isoform X1 [Scylla paramamosain]|uniref:uncharacterized protein LOC135112070 isoform X1 n=1 Tax=Scylla paramamosain TaxID=85552 RepID=UPI003082B28B
MGEEAAKEGDQSGEKEPKNSSAFTKKIIKLMTVAAYMSGVSGAGVLLSLYYIIFWDPRITGVRPPGYLRSGERMGLPEAQAQMAPLPEAYNGKHQIPFPHKMSRQFMEAYLSNYTEDAADRVLGMMDGDPHAKGAARGGGRLTRPAHPNAARTRPPPAP